nr:MAG TPA: polyphosphate kinase [Caudoviricetes sp.]
MFFGIVASNLTEFMQVRYPIEILLEMDDIDDFKDAIATFYQKMIKRWHKFNKNYQLVVPVDELKKNSAKWVEQTFKTEVFPILQPMNVDRSKSLNLHPGTYLLVRTRKSKNDSEKMQYIEIPKGLDRYIAVPNKKFCVSVIDLIQDNLDFMFKDRKIVSSFPFTILRSAQVFDQIDREQDAYTQIVKTLKERERSWITALEVGSTEKSDIKLLRNLLPLRNDSIIFASKEIGLSALKSLPSEIYSDKDKCRKFKPVKTFPKTSIFDYIKSKDRIAFHPYESYDQTMVRFLQEAAADPNVVSIKISLYRVANNSKIVDALLKAADKGKTVTVLVELKARFDEHHNIEIATILREGGVRIAFTNPDIKTHAKLCLVTRKEKKGLKTYAQIGTGNYSESNAKQYTDYSYFTADQDMCFDLTRFFDLMTSDQGIFKSRKVIYAPYNMKDTIKDEIKAEVKRAKSGKEGYIFIKCNGFTDIDIAEAILDAGKAGVKITMLVRGACVIEPTKSIKIYSLVGRFLEHSRVYQFGTGKNARIYIGSADLMGRNLNRRHELLILVENQEIRERLMNHLKVYMKDNTNLRKILPGYKYEMVDQPEKKKNQFSAQDWFINEAKEMGLE